MAPTRKPAERRQRRATKDLAETAVIAEVVTGDFTPAPAGSAGWLAETAEEWDLLWRSDLATRIQPTDHPAVRRLFDWRDRQTRALRRVEVLRDAASEQPMVDGSKGQPVANPLFAAADSAATEALSIETRIVALEDRLGLSPKARLNLGVSEQKGFNLAGQNAHLAMALKEAMAGVADPRALPGDAATEAG